MAKVRVMYWKEIPVQVQGVDESGPVSIPLDDRFQKGVDAISMFDGSAGGDEYLESWDWSGYREAEGSAKGVAEAAAERLNKDFPMDFVTRIRDLQNSGRRDPRPGAVDHWSDDDKS